MFARGITRQNEEPLKRSMRGESVTPSSDNTRLGLQRQRWRHNQEARRERIARNENLAEMRRVEKRRERFIGYDPVARHIPDGSVLVLAKSKARRFPSLAALLKFLGLKSAEQLRSRIGLILDPQENTPVAVESIERAILKASHRTPIHRLSDEEAQAYARWCWLIAWHAHDTLSEAEKSKRVKRRLRKALRLIRGAMPQDPLGALLAFARLGVTFPIVFRSAKADQTPAKRVASLALLVYCHLCDSRGDLPQPWDLLHSSGYDGGDEPTVRQVSDFYWVRLREHAQSLRTLRAPIRSNDSISVVEEILSLNRGRLPGLEEETLPTHAGADRSRGASHSVTQSTRTARPAGTCPAPYMLSVRDW